MKTVDLEKLIGAQLKSLFSSPNYNHFEFINRGYAFPSTVKKDALLFIGLNPSYVKGNASDKKGSHFYDLKETGNYRYYSKFEKLAKELDESWTHLDLLAIRETKQKKIKKLIPDDVGKEMICQNLKVSKSILEETNPKVIIVQNSLARTFLGRDKDKNGNNEWLGYAFELDPILGTDRIKTQNSNLNGVPVFFTSMLTGQRALDKGSYDRPKWHIRKALESGKSI